MTALCRRCDDVESAHEGGQCVACKARGQKCYKFRGPKKTLASSSRLKPVSDHRLEVNIERARLQEEAWGPRPWTCRFNEFVVALFVTTGEVVDGGRCYGKVDGHEILWRGRAGRTDENLLDIQRQVPLCSHHNSYVDEHSLQAKRMGLAISAGEEERQ